MSNPHEYEKKYYKYLKKYNDLIQNISKNIEGGEKKCQERKLEKEEIKNNYDIFEIKDKYIKNLNESDIIDLIKRGQIKKVEDISQITFDQAIRVCTSHFSDLEKIAEEEINQSKKNTLLLTDVDCKTCVCGVDAGCNVNNCQKCRALEHIKNQPTIKQQQPLQYPSKNLKPIIQEEEKKFIGPEKPVDTSLISSIEEQEAEKEEEEKEKKNLSDKNEREDREKEEKDKKDKLKEDNDRAEKCDKQVNIFLEKTQNYININDIHEKVFNELQESIEEGKKINKYVKENCSKTRKNKLIPILEKRIKELEDKITELRDKRKKEKKLNKIKKKIDKNKQEKLKKDLLEEEKNKLNEQSKEIEKTRNILEECRTKTIEKNEDFVDKYKDFMDTCDIFDKKKYPTLTGLIDKVNDRKNALKKTKDLKDKCDKVKDLNQFLLKTGYCKKAQVLSQNRYEELKKKMRLKKKIPEEDKKKGELLLPKEDLTKSPGYGLPGALPPNQNANSPEEKCENVLNNINFSNEKDYEKYKKLCNKKKPNSKFTKEQIYKLNQIFDETDKLISKCKDIKDTNIYKKNCKRVFSILGDKLKNLYKSGEEDAKKRKEERLRREEEKEATKVAFDNLRSYCLTHNIKEFDETKFEENYKQFIEKCDPDQRNNKERPQLKKGFTIDQIRSIRKKVNSLKERFEKKKYCDETKDLNEFNKGWNRKTGKITKCHEYKRLSKKNYDKLREGKKVRDDAGRDAGLDISSINIRGKAEEEEEEVDEEEEKFNIDFRKNRKDEIKKLEKIKKKCETCSGTNITVKKWYNNGCNECKEKIIQYPGLLNDEEKKRINNRPGELERKINNRPGELEDVAFDLGTETTPTENRLNFEPTSDDPLSNNGVLVSPETSGQNYGRTQTQFEKKSEEFEKLTNNEFNISTHINEYLNLIYLYNDLWSMGKIGNAEHLNSLNNKFNKTVEEYFKKKYPTNTCVDETYKDGENLKEGYQFYVLKQNKDNNEFGLGKSNKNTCYYLMKYIIEAFTKTDNKKNKTNNFIRGIAYDIKNDIKKLNNKQKFNKLTNKSTELEKLKELETKLEETKKNYLNEIDYFYNSAYNYLYKDNFRKDAKLLLNTIYNFIIKKISQYKKSIKEEIKNLEKEEKIKLEKKKYLKQQKRKNSIEGNSGKAIELGILNKLEPGRNYEEMNAMNRNFNGGMKKSRKYKLVKK
jgi:hypothetical protein